MGYWDDNAATKADALQVAAADELVGRRAADTEDLGGLLDGEGQRLVGVHVLVGLPNGLDYASDRDSGWSTTLGGEREVAREATGFP